MAKYSFAWCWLSTWRCGCLLLLWLRWNKLCLYLLMLVPLCLCISYLHTSTSIHGSMHLWFCSSSQGCECVYFYAWAFIMPSVSLLPHLHKLFHFPHTVWPWPWTRHATNCIGSAEQKSFIKCRGLFQFPCLYCHCTAAQWKCVFPMFMWIMWTISFCISFAFFFIQNTWSNYSCCLQWW